MSAVEMTVPDQPDPADRAAILAGLAAFNASIAAPGSASLAILIKQDCATVGGLWGTSLYDWLAIELLFVPENLRGQGIGSRLVRQAEEIAKTRNCIGVWLDTFSFQGPGFYEKIGYCLAGQIGDHPVGGARYFLSKRFA